MSDIVSVEHAEQFSLISLDDGKANVVSFAMAEQLNRALDKAEQAGKPVIVVGRPGKFCAGFDLSVMGQGGDRTFELLVEGQELVRKLAAFPVPVILAVSGHALAMGGLLLLSADYRIGIAGDYKLGLNEVAIGMTLPYFGVSLARYRLNDGHFDRAVNLATIYSPQDAVAAGFLDEVVESSRLLDRAKAMATQFCGLDSTAHKNTKLRSRHKLLQELAGSVEREFGRE